MHTCMVLLRGNVALAREYLLSKRHRLIEFRVLIRSQQLKAVNYRVLKVNSST